MEPLDLEDQTLAELGYRMPAEWEPHAATWLAWPKRDQSWPGKLDAIPPVYARLIREIAEGEDIHLLVDGHEHHAAILHLLKDHKADAPNVRLVEIPTNDSWVRDHGPIFVRNRGAGAPLIALDWGYNSWGGKYPPFDLDNAVPARAAQWLRVPAVAPGMVLEGGSIDVNGAGLLLTTEACLLNPNRNPHLDREGIEARLRDFLGISHVLWLGDGIVGDDTDGHIDDLARFVAPETIVTVVEPDKSDANHVALDENLRRLRELRTPSGGSFDIIEIPMPAPVVWEGHRLPASYANFYIANAAVIVPTFRSPKQDDRAIGILGDLFPHRRVVGIDATDLVWGLGAFHCITQQQPAV